ncbi:MAG: DedA family protein [Acidobacteria bacterium]|jgi:membrane-associated protein|nr:MAG: DedA family protein [Acidobacteriales bacterium 13_2_20CM_2_55_5]OLD15889.1 MAG: DedA family protein [Acidobacteriales bacterium 13_1_40CM_3_55_5]PYX16558.1 MAG: DedA family protein [Acidobacteriota bacterium]
MGQHLFELLREYLAHYGYWAVAAALLLENTGVPVPGETMLLLASFLAYSEHRLRLPYIILVGVCAATIGDNLGFLLGHYGGKPLLERYRKVPRVYRTIARGESLIHRYGSFAIFIARFIAGMRIIAGPLASVLHMPWRKFVVFNFLGAAVWVTVISSVGYFFGRHWDELARIMKGFNLAVLLAAVLLAVFFWWRQRRKGTGGQPD